MNKRTARWLSVLLAALFIMPWGALAGDVWRVNVSHDLRGGSWPDGMEVSPYQIEAEVGESMPADSLNAEKLVQPYMAESAFLGWSVLFTNPGDGTVIYNSGDELWDLNHPFDYYPDNPRTMNCLMTAHWEAQQQPAGDVWRVNVSHDLRGGSWPDGMEVSPYQIEAEVGESMPADSLNAEKLVQPYMAESTFLGWSVLFTNPSDGTVIYNSGDELWDLNHPFDYYPDNPRTMNCLMTARWASAQTGGHPPSGEVLPDGRPLTRPFAIGTDPLPEVPPPADTIVPGTAWLTSVEITALEDGVKAPVYAFPIWNGPIIDWVDPYDHMGYGLFLSDGWVMLYSPRWVESGGIGFISYDVIAFPGVDE